MDRRAFLGGLAWIGAMPLPSAVLAGTERHKKLAIVSAFTDKADARYRIGKMIEALRTHGWEEGKNLSIDHRQSGNITRIRALAAEAVQSNPDAIFLTPGYLLPIVLKQTRTIPIIFANMAGPVEQGWVKSIARPGGNATGFTSFEYSIGGQWLRLLKEAAPQMNRVLVLGYKGMFTAERLWRSIKTASQRLQVSATYVPVRTYSEIKRALETYSNPAGTGLICLPHGGLMTNNAKQIADLAIDRKMLSIYGFRPFVDQGGLMSYGNLEADAFRRAAGYIDRVLRGENPAELPIQHPVAFEFVINLKTAQELELTISEILLARANEVLE